MKADAIFEGGGVKGVAFIGALRVMEEHGYTWEKVAGTSAGSIVAALISAGYSSEELSGIYSRLNYLYFLRRKGLGKLPLVGPVFELVFNLGVYHSDPIEQFLTELLQKKGIRYFGDLPKEKLRIIASDITAGKMMILPDDLPGFDIDPDRFPIARAVRMSSSIPYFYQPYVLKHGDIPHYIVDGALLSNYPIWLFDVPGIPEWPTIGFRLHEAEAEQNISKIRGLISYSKALLTTMLDAHDRFYVKKAQAVRTIFIPTLGVRTSNFHLSAEQRKALYESGERAAKKFLQTWSFEAYVRDYRTMRV